MDQLYKVVAAILLLANIEFNPDDDDNAAISDWSADCLVRAADLLGLDDAELEDALISVKSRAGGEYGIHYQTFPVF